VSTECHDFTTAADVLVNLSRLAQMKTIVSGNTVRLSVTKCAVTVTSNGISIGAFILSTVINSLHPAVCVYITTECELCMRPLANSIS